MDEDTLWLDCPKCGESVGDIDGEMLAYHCPSCGLNFDMVVCENCGEMVGTYWGDDDICPSCGEKHTT